MLFLDVPLMGVRAVVKEVDDPLEARKYIILIVKKIVNKIL